MVVMYVKEQIKEHFLNKIRIIKLDYMQRRLELTIESKVQPEEM